MTTGGFEVRPSWRARFARVVDYDRDDIRSMSLEAARMLRAYFFLVHSLLQWNGVRSFNIATETTLLQNMMGKISLFL